MEKIKDLDFPTSILIDTVSYCNLRCSMCAHKDMTRKKGIMKWDLFKKIIDEIAEVDKNTRLWMVFFGEALILKRTKPSIFDMVSYAKSVGLKNVVLNSNGVLLDKESSKKLVDAGLDAIYIGIDAFSEDTYNKLRVGGDYNKVVQNVLDLIEVKKEKSATINIDIQVQFVEMEENIKERNDFTKYWISQGVNVKIRKKLSWAGLIESKTVNNIDVERHKCYWIMNSISITDTGNVTTCAADPDARFVAGNIKEQSIKEVWNGKLKELRDIHRKGKWDRLPYPCNQCKDWKISYKDELIQAKKRNVIKKMKKYFSKFRVLSGK